MLIYNGCVAKVVAFVQQTFMMTKFTTIKTLRHPPQFLLLPPGIITPLNLIIFFGDRLFCCLPTFHLFARVDRFRSEFCPQTYVQFITKKRYFSAQKCGISASML